VSVVVVLILGFFLYPLTQSGHSSKSLRKSKPATCPLGYGDFRQNDQGHWLYYREWHPASESTSPPRGLIFISHGFAEHINRNGYKLLAQKLSEEGFAVFAQDHQGHGYSDGDRGYFERFDHVVNDFYRFITNVSSVYQVIPRFIFGHSMGSLVALKTVFDHSTLVDGIVLSGCGIYVNPDLKTPLLMAASSFLSNNLPKLVVQSLDPNLISTNPHAITAYIDDPLVFHGGIKARFGAEFLDTAEEIIRRASELTLPFLTLHGSDDKITLPKGSQILYDNALSKDKRLKYFPGGYHELFEDLKLQNDFFQEIISWFSSHVNVKHE